MYIVIRSEKDVWTVGYGNPEIHREWHPVMDFDNPDDASDYADWKNGGDAHIRQRLEDTVKSLFPEVYIGDVVDCVISLLEDYHESLK